LEHHPWLASQPVTLTVEQIELLNRQLSHMRHDINNNLSLILAATELIRYKPQALDRMIGTFGQRQNYRGHRPVPGWFEKTLHCSTDDTVSQAHRLVTVTPPGTSGSA
jgi:hypothetical protein